MAHLNCSTERLPLIRPRSVTTLSHEEIQGVDVQRRLSILPFKDGPGHLGHHFGPVPNIKHQKILTRNKAKYRVGMVVSYKKGVSARFG